MLKEGEHSSLASSPIPSRKSLNSQVHSMPNTPLRVLVIFDVPYHWDPTFTAEKALRGEEWQDERDVVNALKQLGHMVDVFGIYDEIAPLLGRISEFKPDCVFNLCESFRTDRSHEANLAALLELLDIAYTGAKPEALNLCKDKGVSKSLLQFHGIRVPKFQVIPVNAASHAALTQFEYPAVCKPLVLDSSEGIAQNSLVKNSDEAYKRLLYLHTRYGCDAILEEYIPGRELYVGMLGNDTPKILPPRELFFGSLPKQAPRLLTYKAKWNQEYRDKYGIDSGKAENLDRDLRERIEMNCRDIYRIFKLSGYARIDLRLDAANEPVFIEANPNPSIKKADDFAEAASDCGISYSDLVGEIVDLALLAA